jgi:hypothetical protein
MGDIIAGLADVAVLRTLARQMLGGRARERSSAPTSSRRIGC